MSMKTPGRSILLVFCIFLLIVSPACAQMNRGKNMGSGMNPMKHMYGYEQYDSRFGNFESKTFKEVSDSFGIPVEDALADLGLPEDMDTQLTILDIENKYGISEQEIASYMVMSTHRINASYNSRDKLLMRQQAIQTMRQNTGQRMFFVRQGSLAYGNFTSFNFNESGVIENFAAGGDLIFSSVTISDFDYLDEQINGATAFYQGVDSQVFLQDSPMGIFQIRALANKTVKFNLADGVKASQDNDLSNYSGDVAPVKITSEDFEGYLITFINPYSTDPEKTLEGFNVKISDNEVTFNLVKNSVVMFRANSMPNAFIQSRYNYSPGYAHMHQALSRGISTGRVGAEIAFRNGTDQGVFVNYAPIELHIKDRERDRLVLGVSSETQEGKVITINVDNETIDLSRPERIRLRYDGTVIENASSIDELFAGGTVPLCYMLEENGTATMAVYIPKFSEHEIVIDLAPEGEESNSQIEENISEIGENETESKETETRNENAAPAESIPAFNLWLAAAGLITAYGLKRRK